MRKHNIAVVSVFFGLFLSSSLFAQQNTAASLQGYSGLFNIPNAYVIAYGTGSVQYADQFIIQNEYLHNNNFMVNLGVFPHLEISNRLSKIKFKTISNIHRVMEKGLKKKRVK